MDMRLFEYTAEIYKKGSFTKAADSLHIAQPSLSQQIKKLEGELGFPLLSKKGSRVTHSARNEVYSKSPGHIAGKRRSAARNAGSAPGDGYGAVDRCTCGNGRAPFASAIEDVF